MYTIALETQNCIVTGKTASVFSGHVTAHVIHSLTDEPFVIKVHAGFCDLKTCHDNTPNAQGCHGEWKPEHGLKEASCWRTGESGDLINARPVEPERG